MKSLSDLQQDFCDALRSPDAPSRALLDEIVDDGLALQRFNVYRNNFIVLNGDALADMYPVIKRLVGESAFRMLATAYVRDYPPMNRALLLYGENFPQFLASIPELSGLAYLPDVARLEYAWTEAYHAEDVERVKEGQLTGLPAGALEQLRLKVHPSMRCLRSEYPVYRIWAANQQDHSGEVISLDEGPSRIVVIRPGAEVEVREVSEGVMMFLERLNLGDTVAEAYACTVALDPLFDLNAFFARHLFDGTFCSSG